MPAYSTEVADRFIERAKEDGRVFNQMQLQGLVYIAHGCLLAEAGRPLTADRPEAKPFGPEYCRLANALSFAGAAPVVCRTPAGGDPRGPAEVGRSVTLDTVEEETICRIYRNYGNLSGPHLDLLISGAGDPWSDIYSNGNALHCEISDDQAKAQFEALTAFFGLEKSA